MKNFINKLISVFIKISKIIFLSRRTRSIANNIVEFKNKHHANMITNRLDNSAVSVVIPCFNHSKYLESLFYSLIHQTYRPFEVVFVEDHSSDDTLIKLQDLCHLLPPGISHKIIQTSKNSGQCNAINLGIENTLSSVIMVLNDDDYLMHDAIETSIEIFMSHVDIYLFGSTSVWFAGTGKPDYPGELLIKRNWDIAEIPLKYYYPIDIDKITHPNDINLTHSGSVFAKNAWESVGGYYRNKKKRVCKYSDRDFQLRVASLFPVAVSTEVPFVFWRTDSSVDGNLLS